MEASKVLFLSKKEEGKKNRQPIVASMKNGYNWREIPVGEPCLICKGELLVSAFKQRLPGAPENRSISPSTPRKELWGEKLRLRIQSNLSPTPKSMCVNISKAERIVVGPPQHTVFPECLGPGHPTVAACLGADTTQLLSPQVCSPQQEQS